MPHVTRVADRPASSSQHDTNTPSPMNKPLLITKTCALAVFALGALVIYGWYTHNLALLQIHPSFVAMQFNTALGFVLCALVLWGLATQSKRLL